MYPPENHEGKKNPPIPARDQTLAPKSHTVLETRKTEGKKTNARSRTNASSVQGNFLHQNQPQRENVPSLKKLQIEIEEG